MDRQVGYISASDRASAPEQETLYYRCRQFMAEWTAWEPAVGCEYPYVSLLWTNCYKPGKGVQFLLLDFARKSLQTTM